MGELEAIVGQIQADDGPEILTRSATPIPMPNGETAPQADGHNELLIPRVTKHSTTGTRSCGSRR
jgi:hypothetical protein